MTKLMIWVIKFYKRTLSVLISSNALPLTLNSSCKFYPSCSEYAVKSIEKHGVLKGLGRAIFRVVRCNPLSRPGIDLP